MESQYKELEFHSRISEKIYRTVGEISDEMEDGIISTSAARKIIKLVRNFNFTREVLLERHRSELISLDEFHTQEAEEGQRCIDEIYRIISEAIPYASA